DVSHLYRWRVPNLLTGGEHISPASLKRQEEVLPAAKLEQRRYNSIENGSRSGGLVKIITVLLKS
ncbi:MAG: hypothetical protein IIZ16_00890, partial [Selenomonas sp.]|nr:hypothetical protein [Selenomonas sp.]